MKVGDVVRWKPGLAHGTALKPLKGVGLVSQVYEEELPWGGRESFVEVMFADRRVRMPIKHLEVLSENA